MATALRYKNEVRNEKDYFDDIENIKVPADMLKLASHILESKKGHFNPDKFEDRYEDALKDLIKAKRAGKAPPVVSEPKPSNVINLMDALRRSAQGERDRPAATRRNGARSKRSAPRRKARRASKRDPERRITGSCAVETNAGLNTYRAKRRFGVTAEPKGKVGAQARPRLRHPEARRDGACTTICGSSSTA